MIFETRERLRRKLQKLSGQYKAAQSSNRLAGRSDVSVCTFFDVEGEYAMPGESCSEMVREILPVLQEYRVTSSFNVVAALANEDSEMVKLITDYGHEISSHSASHQVLSNMSRADQAEDVRRTMLAFSDLDVDVIGHRSPQSAWDGTLVKILSTNNFKWNAEDGPEPYPYMLTKTKTSESGLGLWRMPVMIDDWGYQSENIAPAVMLDRWKVTVDEAMHAGHNYLAIGFHPWVQGFGGRLSAFIEFMRWLTSIREIDTCSFARIVEKLESTSSDLSP